MEDYDKLGGKAKQALDLDNMLDGLDGGSGGAGALDLNSMLDLEELPDNKVGTEFVDLANMINDHESISS